MDVKKMATDLIELFGGEDNIKDVMNCLTRVRFRVKDKEKVNQDAIKALPGVLELIIKGGYYQVVIGGEAKNVCIEITKIANITEVTAGDEGADADESVFMKVAGFLSACAVPTINALFAGGMVKSIMAVLSALGVAGTDSTLYTFLSWVADAAWYFMPFFYAKNAAKKLGCNEGIAMLLAGAMLHPTWTSIVSAGEEFKLFGLNVSLISYASSMFPIVLTILFQSYVEKLLNKFMPSSFKSLILPLVTTLIVAPCMFLFIGPIGNFVGNYIGMFFSWLNDLVPWFVPALLGAVTPPLVMTGTHLAIIPIQTTYMAMYGFDPIVMAGFSLSNLAQGGATLAVARMTKKKEMRQLAIPTGISCVLGITEPALYGVELKYGKPFIGSIIGGGLGGLVAGILGLKSYTTVFYNVFAFLGFVQEGNAFNLWGFVICEFVAFFGAYISTRIMGIKED